MTSSNSDASGGRRAGGICPECGAPTADHYTPFCSKRCADIDLHRWLAGGYAIPAGDVDDAALAGDEGAGQAER